MKKIYHKNIHNMNDKSVFYFRVEKAGAYWFIYGLLKYFYLFKRITKKYETFLVSIVWASAQVISIRTAGLVMPSRMLINTQLMRDDWQMFGFISCVVPKKTTVCMLVYLINNLYCEVYWFLLGQPSICSTWLRRTETFVQNLEREENVAAQNDFQMVHRSSFSSKSIVYITIQVGSREEEVGDRCWLLCVEPKVDSN